jgi:S-adenosylmethionine hydrolase
VNQFDTVSFLSDFGNKDEFVGVVKSVIRSIAPHVTTIDITHEIPRHDVRAGSLALVRSVQYLCPGVALAVVDPGVGSERRAVAVEVAANNERGYFVGPDNGLLASAVAMAGGASRAVVLDNEKFHLPAPGPTFAARDIFAPAAAQLCLGTDLSDLGTAVDTHTLLPGVLPIPQVSEEQISCEVLWVDHFGNAQLNVSAQEIAPLGIALVVRIGEQVRRAKVVNSYSELKGGELGVAVDSYGMAALVLDRMSAADTLALHESDAVVLEAAK